MWELKNDNPLPEWVTYGQDTDGLNKLIVDVSKAYPAVLRELGLSRDQYGVTVAQHVIIAELTEYGGQGTRIKFAATEGSEKYRLAVLPPGKGEDAGAGDAMIAWIKLKEKRKLAAL